MRTSSVLASLVLVLGCGAPGTHPHDMSTAGHEQVARDEEQLAVADEAPRPEASCDVAPCWTISDASRAEAAHHRELAAQHRAAAVALRDAEDRACAGLDEDSRDESPFMHREDIASVEELTEEVQAGHSVIHRRVGATVVFRAVRGLTREWLQRVVDCHLARNAALGHDVPEMPYCPLVPMGVTAEVRSLSAGFAVDVRAPSGDAADEVLRRARSLTDRAAP